MKPYCDHRKDGSYHGTAVGDFMAMNGPCAHCMGILADARKHSSNGLAVYNRHSDLHLLQYTTDGLPGEQQLQHTQEMQ